MQRERVAAEKTGQQQAAYPPQLANLSTVMRDSESEGRRFLVPCHPALIGKSHFSTQPRHTSCAQVLPVSNRALTWVNACIRIHAYMHEVIHPHMHTDSCAYSYVHVHVHSHMYIHVYKVPCVQAHTHACTNTHTNSSALKPCVVATLSNRRVS